MKLFPIVLVMLCMNSTVFAQGESSGNDRFAFGYTGHLISDDAANASNAIQDVSHAIAVPAAEATHSVWGFLADVGNGAQKNIAISAGNGVAINASVYSLELREAERKNTELTQVAKDLKERTYWLERSTKETKRLETLASDYKTDAENFQKKISAGLLDLSKASDNLAGWDKKKQENLEAALKAHQELGADTSKSGDPEYAKHALISLTAQLENLEVAIKSAPDAAQKGNLTAKLEFMQKMLAEAQKKQSETEAKMAASTETLRLLNASDKVGLADKETTLRRQMTLASLNNSVNNLITQAEFSKVRSQLAFSHFGEIAKEVAGKGISAKDIKSTYKNNSKALAEQYNNTPMGVYVNSQIAKAMSSVCDLVNNQCRESNSEAFIDFLDDSSRNNYKTPSTEVQPPITPPADTVTK